jgi:hypothetical protein
MDLENPVQKPPESEGGDRPSNENSGQAPPPIPPATEATRPPPSPNNDAKPKEKRRDWLDRVKIGFEIAGVVALIAYTTFAALLWCEAKRQTKVFRDEAAQAKCDAAKQLAAANNALTASKDAFRRDQQPYLWTTGIPAYGVYPDPGTAKSQVTLDEHYMNYGKSPAVSVQRSTDVEIGPDALKKIHNIPFGTAKSLIPPTENDFFTGVTPPTENLPDLSKDFTVVIFSRFRYRDTLGNLYETDVCMARLATSAWQYCEKHNEIKDCSELACGN